MTTLFAIASELHISLDELFGEAGSPGTRRSARSAAHDGTRTLARAANAAEPGGNGKHVQRARTRSTIDLESGVRWERLTPTGDDDRGVAFLYVIYDIGGSSSPDGSLMTHGGREYGLVLSGWLEVTIGSETYELGPGDSVCFDSTVPHRVRNIGTEPVHGVWVGVGRRADRRLHAFRASAAGGSKK
jgi:mannose-6-phosphate isomerase-like protein (cupin superfamily)